MRPVVIFILALLSGITLGLVVVAVADDSSDRLKTIRSQISEDTLAPALSVGSSQNEFTTADDTELRKREDEILSKIRASKANIEEKRGQGRLVEPQIQVVGKAGNQRMLESERVQLGMVQGATERQSRELDDLAKTFDNMKASLKNIVTDAGPVAHSKAKLSAPKVTETESATLVTEPRAGKSNLEIILEPRVKTKPKVKLPPSPINRPSVVDDINRYVTDDMPLAVINVDQADLWTGPSEDDTLLMLLPRDAKVAIETRVDEWYRVRTAQGVRAWLHGSVIAFGPDLRSVPSRFIRIRAYDSSIS